MTTSAREVLSYHHFVEYWCQEENGTFRSGPSGADVRAAADRLKLPRPRSSTNSSRPALPAYQRWFADWHVLSESRRQLFGEWHHYSACRWCGAGLSYFDDSDPLGRFTRIERRTCHGCGWWDTDAYLPAERDGKDHSGFSIHRRAILKKFDITSADVPVADLARHVTKYPQSVFRVEPYKLEELVANVFSRTMDCTVQWLGGPGDGGIDLLLVQGDHTWAVQIKRKSSPDSPIRVALIREFVGAIVIEGITKGIFVTTSSFTKPALRTAVRAMHRPGLSRVDLMDGSRLIECCRLASSMNSTRAASEHYEEPLLSHHLRHGMTEFEHMGWRP